MLQSHTYNTKRKEPPGRQNQRAGGTGEPLVMGDVATYEKELIRNFSKLTASSPENPKPLREMTRPSDQICKGFLRTEQKLHNFFSRLRNSILSQRSLKEHLGQHTRQTHKTDDVLGAGRKHWNFYSTFPFMPPSLYFSVCLIHVHITLYGSIQPHIHTDESANRESGFKKLSLLKACVHKGWRLLF